MDARFNKRLSFIGDWFQEEAGIIRSFYIYFYSMDNAVEVFDRKTKKVFLRRTKMNELSEKDFFVGSKISIFGRQFDIVDYGDEVTKNSLAKFRKRTFVLLKTAIISSLSEILCKLNDSKFAINNGRMVQFTTESAARFCGDNSKGDVEASVLMNQLIAGPSIGLELVAENALEKIKMCASGEKSMYKEGNVPGPLISLFDDEAIRNGVYCAQTDEEADRKIEFFFTSKSGLSCTTRLEKSTLAVIKPHAIKEGNLGTIVSAITSNGFKITGLKMCLMERVNCEEFYEVYRGVLPEYMQMVSQLASGVCMALELVASDGAKDIYSEFRTFCGPMDPEIAKQLRPHTLRAKYGVNKVQNAIHCTDLPEDTILEIEYFFKILD